jgi:hypothetical protein
MATELTLEFAGLRVIFTAGSIDEAWGLVRQLSELRNGPDGPLSSSYIRMRRVVVPSLRARTVGRARLTDPRAGVANSGRRPWS